MAILLLPLKLILHILSLILHLILKLLGSILRIVEKPLSKTGIAMLSLSDDIPILLTKPLADVIKLIFKKIKKDRTKQL